MINKTKQIKTFGITTITLSALVGIPSIILLFSMLTGIGRQTQFGYSLYVVVLIVLGTIPALLSIIFGIITYAKYHKNKKLYYNSKKLATLALLLPILTATLMTLAILLDAFMLV